MGQHALLRGAATPLIVLLAVATTWSCGPGDRGEPAGDETVRVAGRYQVRGMTTDPSSPDKRRIEGIVILAEQGDRYTATFELKTNWPIEGGFTDAQVVGVGEGRIEGNKLTGTAQTQLVISSVPGVDTGFAFIPRMVTTRLVSESVATLTSDGAVTIDIENRGADGEDYRATRTRISGHRIPDSGPGTRDTES
jgi:hypothetical protein